MRTMIRGLVGLGLVAMLAGPVFAQGRGGFGRGGGSLAGLLGNASVQKELKLDDEQTGKAKEVSEKITGEIREKMQGFQDLSPEERRDKRQAIDKEFNEATLKAVGAFLKPEQIARLKQVSYQAARCECVCGSRGRRQAQSHRQPEERDPDDQSRINEPDAGDLPVVSR